MRVAALLLVALLPVSAMGTRAERNVRERAQQKSVVELRPELVLMAGLYSGRFQSAAGIHCDRHTGEIYVTDPASGTVEIFAENGAPLFVFSDEERLPNPSRLAVDRDGNMYLLDGNRPIKVYDYRGEFVKELALPGFAPGQKTLFSAITFDVNGDLYVGESRSGQVLVYDRELNPKLRFGSYGDGPGQFLGIVGIAVDEKQVYVASSDGVAVQVFTRQGRLVRGWGHHDAGLDNVSLPAAIAVDGKGRVILLDTLRQEIKYFSPEGKLIELFGGLGHQLGAVAYPTDLSMDRNGRLCVADNGNQRAQVLKPIDAQPDDASPTAAAP